MAVVIASLGLSSGGLVMAQARAELR